MADITGLLARWTGGDRGAFDQLAASVYGPLRRMAGDAMRGERSSHTLQATALVHEAFVRLAESVPPRWHGRDHFFAVASRLMRRILVDHARQVKTTRRGAAWQRVPLVAGNVSARTEPDGAPLADLLTLDTLLERLARFDRRKARVIELRYFGGLSVKETARVLSVSVPTVILDTRMAKAWLLTRMARDADGS